MKKDSWYLGHDKDWFWFDGDRLHYYINGRFVSSWNAFFYVAEYGPLKPITEEELFLEFI